MSRKSKAFCAIITSYLLLITAFAPMTVSEAAASKAGASSKTPVRGKTVVKVPVKKLSTGNPAMQSAEDAQKAATSQSYDYESFEKVFNSQTLPYRVNTTEKKTTLKNPSVKLKSNVVMAQNNAFQGISVKKSGTLNKQKLIKAVNNKTLKRGSIILEKVGRKAVKITGVDSAGDYLYDKPAMTDAFESIDIPKQSADLTAANIIGSAVPCKITQLKNSPYLESLLKSGKIKPLVQNPLSGNRASIGFMVIEQEFSGYQVKLDNIIVTIDGKIKLAGLRFNADYSAFDGYDFSVFSGEEIEITAKINADLKKDIDVPILGFDTSSSDSGFGVGIGLYLHISIDGTFEIVTTFGEGFSVEAGVHGSTFFGLPTSFHPYLTPDCYVNCDADMAGRVSASAGIGPGFCVTAFGIDLVGGEVRLTGIVNTALSGKYLDIDIDGWVWAHLVLLGENMDLLNERWSILEKKVKDMQGATIAVTTVDGYRDLVEGTVSVSQGTQGNVPYSGDIDIFVDRGGTKTLTYSAKSLNGSYSVDLQKLSLKGESPINLQNGDKVRVGILGNTNTTDPVAAVNPFQSVELDYVDYFNDISKGKVGNVQIGVDSTGRPQYLKYNKDIYLNNLSDNTKIKLTAKDGEFNCSYPFYGMDSYNAELNYDGWSIKSETLLSDPGLTFAMSTKEVTDTNDYTYLDNYEFMFFRAVNYRGTKEINETVHFNCYESEPKNKMVIEHLTSWYDLPKIAASAKDYTFPLEWAGTNSHSDSVSKALQLYIYRWKNASESSSSGVNSSTGVSGNTATVGELMESTDAAINFNPSTPTTGGILKRSDADLKVINPGNKIVRKDANLNTSTSQGKPIQSQAGTATINTRVGLLSQVGDNVPTLTEIRAKWKDVEEDYTDPGAKSIFDSDTMFSYFIPRAYFTYEGEKIYAKNAQLDNKKTKQASDNESAPDSGTIQQVIENARNRVWTTHPDSDYYVNLEILKERYSAGGAAQTSAANESSLPSWSIQGVRDMTSWGVMGLGEGGVFNGNKITTKGELTAYLVRLCGLKHTGSELGFTDVGSSYPYRSELQAAYENGLIDIPGNKMFNPNITMTRESAAIMVYTALIKMFGTEKVQAAAIGKTAFTDVTTLSAGSKTAIQNLARLGLYDGIVAGEFKSATKVSMAETAAVLDRMARKFITN